MAINDTTLTTSANVIKNETTIGANTATRVGQMLDDIIGNKINNDKIATSTELGTDDTLVPSQKAVKSYVDNAGLPYKIYTALLSVSGGDTSVIQLKNTIGDGSGDGTNDIAWTVTGNGVIHGVMTAGNPFTTNKSWTTSAQLSSVGNAYIVGLFAAGPTLVVMEIVKYDGTQSGTPNFTNLPIEIRVYP